MRRSLGDTPAGVLGVTLVSFLASSLSLPAPLRGVAPARAAEVAPTREQLESEVEVNLSLSPGLRPWLAAHGVSLGVTTYTVNKLLLVGPGGGPLGRDAGSIPGPPAVAEHRFTRAMALAGDGRGGLLVSDKTAVHRLRRSPAARGTFCVAASHAVAGSESEGLDVHDVASPEAAKGASPSAKKVPRPWTPAEDGSLAPTFGVATGLNAVIRLPGGDASPRFDVVWSPAWISGKDAGTRGDRCHLNGLCLDPADGAPRYVTVVGEGASEVDGWRGLRRDGGCVVDVKSGKVVARGLSMPHSPRLDPADGRLWVLEAGSGWMGWVDLQRAPEEAFRRHVWLPGFLRGLAFLDDSGPKAADGKRWAVVGLSKPRHAVFGELPLGEELDRRKQDAVCGLVAVDLDAGKPVHLLRLEGELVQEVYDVAVVPGVTSPAFEGA